jgi:hypothetical protein
MKYLYLSIDLIGLIVTYVLIAFVLLTHRVDGLEAIEFGMIALLFADRMQNEVKKDLEL